MLKYVDVLVSFQEVPDEISLCINISNCPCHCEGCHSSYLAKDIGEPLTVMDITNLINKNKGISCICFMGGDISPKTINSLAVWVRNAHPELKIAWYSGRSEISKYIKLRNFDYIKIGPYIPKLGGLDKETTNQIMYKIQDNQLTNITYRFRHGFKDSV